ncbi:MAG: nucleoside-diphosphate sugar epimerase/dehydratase [Methyloligellaceae bacterium]
MRDLSKRFGRFLVALPRWVKRLLLVSADFCILSFAIWAAFSLRLSQFYIPERGEIFYLIALAPVIGIATFWARGLYRIVTRYIGQEASPQIHLTVAFAVLLWALIVFLSGVPGVPRSVVIIYGLLAAGLIRLSRHYAALILKAEPLATPASPEKTNVVIYGAGSTGLQLLQALRNSSEYRPVGFVDNDKTLWGQTIQKLKVYRPDKIEKLISRNNVKEIFLALSSAPLSARRAVIRSLESLPVVVKTLPALEDIASGKVRVSDLRPIDVEDLLGRDPVEPDANLLSRNITGKSVMITGAGGSIGSELTRQVLKLRPARLVLFELSEVALYDIEAEARQIVAEVAAAGGAAEEPTQIVAVLGSVLDGPHVERILSRYRVDTIYHAAAYKHVPIVEENPGTGLINNTFGTLTVAEAALACGVERMVLISTDKAVRPTNVMGASKRLAELILQAVAAEDGPGTVFTMVRFGNVLDSSGSVVRRFRKQIEAGGPVTVTHPDITRYFMSIPEAAQLVIQAGAMATGGEVFVLDMGRPVKIDDLARTMIRLSGLAPRDDANPDGDIAIEYVGLRPGEKLYEELLIGENSAGTSHPRILKNNEPFLPLAALRKELDALREAIDAYDDAAIEAILKRTVEGYARSLPPAEPAAGEAAPAGEWRPPSRTLH